ncbi:MAG: hypothetical protein LKK00_09360 [Intestinimonas sp.]|jgi:hypothetical protein|nr:hypothetical protein [Intestinimonas sp.]
MKSSKLILAVALVVCAAILVPAIYVCIHGWDTLDNWMTAYGSYLGALIGALATLFAFSGTFLQNQKQHDELRRENGDLRKHNDEMYAEQKRLQALPFINIYRNPSDWPGSSPIPILEMNMDGIASKLGETDTYKIQNGLDIKLVNIGVGAAIDIHFGDYYLGHMSVGDEFLCELKLPRNSPDNILSITMTYADRDGRRYRQTVDITHRDGQNDIKKNLDSKADIFSG